ncbi:MAG: PKD domain-containing protein, partial [Chitinophagaceae bacterium]|nr:PKD domain-containing protein [Chitinophagaceae bacterium]MBL7749312.1 PKD domain-containing protein [Chitinophagaceae bacterium]
MKSIKYLSCLVLLMAFAISCKKEINDDVSFVENAVSPDQLSVLFEITQDNTGLVTITPNGNGVARYEVYYGHGAATPTSVAPGKNTTHIYPEGVYTVRIVAYSVTGKVTEITKPLTVSFRAPEDLVASVTVDAANNFKVNVTASALYETNFRVFFGDVVGETGLVFLEGQTPSHVYAAVGTYTVRVVAYSGGAATTTYTTTITITDPVLLPLTFESPTVNYTFTNFGGGVATRIDNPQSGGINTSAKVGRMVKNAPEIWAGSFIALGNPIDFSANKVFRMKVFSPRVGAKVLLKTENLTNGSIFFEKEVLTTVANAWEDLAFDFRTINTANSYQKVVLIFDFGVVGDGSPNFTWLFDDIRLVNQMPVGILNLPVTFDLPGVNYEVIDFGGNQSVEAADPLVPANKVKKTTKPTGAEVWAGTTMGDRFSAPIPFTATKTQMSVRVYSPA